jgi:hypothetical protein
MLSKKEMSERAVFMASTRGITVQEAEGVVLREEGLRLSTMTINEQVAERARALVAAGEAKTFTSAAAHLLEQDPELYAASQREGTPGTPEYVRAGRIAASGRVSSPAVPDGSAKPSAIERFTAAAQEIQTSRKISFTKALEIAADENGELYEAYLSEVRR